MTPEMRQLIHIIAIGLCIPMGELIAAWYAPRYGYERKSAITYALAVNVIIVFFSNVILWIARWFGCVLNQNSYRSYLFVPLFTLAVSKRWKIPALQGADFMTPNIFFARALALVGCNVQGCAAAIPCSWGQYSPTIGCRVFPMDFIDMIATFSIGIFSIVYANKLNYKGNGRVFALSMYLLAIVRAAIQFGCRERWWGIRGINDETLYSLIAVIIAITIYKKHSVATKTIVK